MRTVADPATGAVLPPIYVTSTYAQESSGVTKGFDYSRTSQSDAVCLGALRSDLEAHRDLLSLPEWLDQCRAGAAGFGSHVIDEEHYGGNYRLFEKVRRRSRVDFSFST